MPRAPTKGPQGFESRTGGWGRDDKVDPYEDYPVDKDKDTENPEVALQIAKDIR